MTSPERPRLLVGCLVLLVTLVSQAQAKYYCPLPWVQYFDRCIRMYTSSYRYADAETQCAGHSYNGAVGTLYAPRSRQDLALFDHLDWLNWRLWVGVTRNASLGVFVNSEGNPVSQDMFFLGLTEGDGLDCAAYDFNLGRLYLESCTDSRYYFCQLRANTPTDTCSPSFLPMIMDMNVVGSGDHDLTSTGMASNYWLYYFAYMQYSYTDVYGMTYCGVDGCNSDQRNQYSYYRSSSANFKYSSLSSWRSYEYICLKDDERTPLLFGIPGKLNVSFSASSFINYARPEYVLMSNYFTTGSHRVCKWYREYYGDLDVNQNGDACVPGSAWPATTSKCRTSSLSITCVNSAGSRQNCEVPECSSQTYSNMGYYSGRGLQNHLSEMFMNKKVKIPYTSLENGFTEVFTNNFEANVTADSLYYLLIDLKTLSLVTQIIPYTTTAGQLICIWAGVSDTWNSSLDESAFAGWTSCGVNESPDTSDGHLFFLCPAGTVARYVVLTRRKSCGYHVVSSLKIEGDHYYDVNFLPGSSFVNKIPESMEADLRVNRNVTFSTLIRDTYADFFLTHGTTYSEMLDKRIRFRLHGDSSSQVLWISGGWVLNKQISSSEIPLTATFYRNKASTLAQMGKQNVFDFHDVSLRFPYNASVGESLNIEVFIDSTLVGVFSDPSDAANFTVNSAGFSKKSGDTEANSVVVQFPGVQNTINAGFWQPSAFYGDNQDWHQVAFSSLVWIYYTGYSRGMDSNDKDVGAYYTTRLWSADLITWVPMDMIGTDTSYRSLVISNTVKDTNFLAVKPQRLLLGMRHMEVSYHSNFQLKFMLYGKVADDMSGRLNFPWLVSRYQRVQLWSTYSSTYPGYRATDGVTNPYATNSYFMVSSTSGLRWAYVDLAVPRNFSYVVIYTRNAADGGRLKFME